MEKTIEKLEKLKKKANRLTWLPKNYRKDPMSFVQEFCSQNNLQDVRTELWEWLVSALSSSDKEYSCNRKRANLLWLYQQMNELAEASFLINKEECNKKKKNK